MMQKENSTDWKKKKQEASRFSLYSAMTFQMLVIIFAGVFGGVELDKWLHTRFPIFTLILSFIGVILAIFYFIKDFIKFKK